MTATSPRSLGKSRLLNEVSTPESANERGRAPPVTEFSHEHLPEKQPKDARETESLNTRILSLCSWGVSSHIFQSDAQYHRERSGRWKVFQRNALLIKRLWVSHAWLMWSDRLHCSRLCHWVFLFLVFLCLFVCLFCHLTLGGRQRGGVCRYCNV